MERILTLNFGDVDLEIQVPRFNVIVKHIIRCAVANLKAEFTAAAYRRVISAGRDILVCGILLHSVNNAIDRHTGNFAISVKRSHFFAGRIRHVIYPFLSQRIPSVRILGCTGHCSGKFRIDINPSAIRRGRNRRLLIPAAGNPIRQRPHRHQIDEHQRRHQNGYKAFYFIPHCLILLFHLEAALPLLPERSKRICGQTVRRLKKKIWEKRARHSCAPVSAASAGSTGSAAAGSAASSVGSVWTTGGFFQLMLSTDTRQK